MHLRTYGRVSRRLLETNKALPEAKHLNQSRGSQEVVPFKSGPYAHHWHSKKKLTKAKVSGG